MSLSLMLSLSLFLSSPADVVAELCLHFEDKVYVVIAVDVTDVRAVVVPDVIVVDDVSISFQPSRCCCCSRTQSSSRRQS